MSQPKTLLAQPIYKGISVEPKGYKLPDRSVVYSISAHNEIADNLDSLNNHIDSCEALLLKAKYLAQYADGLLDRSIAIADSCEKENSHLRIEIENKDTKLSRRAGIIATQATTIAVAFLLLFLL